MSDAERMKNLIREKRWSLVTAKKAEAAGWPHEAAVEALDALVSEGFLEAMGSLGISFKVRDEEPAPAADEPAPTEEPAPAAAEPAQEPVQEAAPRLKKPDFKKPSKLDRLLAQIEASEAPKVFEGGERDAKASETLERMMDIIVRVNGGITSLSERAGYGIVDPDTDLITILREESGIRASYSPDGGRTDRVLFFEAWPKAMTEKWCETAVARLEKQAVDLLDRMTQYCVKASRPKKSKR